MTYAAASAWTQRSERGSLPLLRLMVWLSLRLGRAPARIVLRLIALYFVVFARGSRRASREFLARSLGRAPTATESYRLFFNFASTLHDRVFFLAGRLQLFDIEIQGTELLGSGGAFLMGAHLGSFEAIRAAGRGRKVAMAMYPDNARKVNGVLSTIDPALQEDIVSLGRPGAMIELRNRLEAGAVVGVLADRTLADEAVVEVDFLGHPARFPTGPMRMAAALQVPVFFMIGIYRGANRYVIRFERLADFSMLQDVRRADRDHMVNEAVVQYARRVEHYARLAPDNWFNFHRFWT
ncbi:MAG: acyl-CoA synthetase [Pseudomonadota bacterium]|nr:acyl-CoA synthetase [Pseudomonadota bacterium]